MLLLLPEGGRKDPIPVPVGGGVIPPHGGSSGGYHFAFSIATDEAEPWQRHLECEGVAVESVVSWPGKAKSIDFATRTGTWPN